MPDDDNQTPNVNVDDDSTDSDNQDNTDSALTLEKLSSEVAELRSQNVQAVRNFNLQVGRLQSLVAKIDSGRGDTDKLITQFNSQVSAVDGAINAILEDETLAPDIKAKVAQARIKANSDSELATLKAEMAAIKTGSIAPPTTGELSLEASIVEEIESFGLNPDDDTFDWKGEASNVLTTKGPAATRTYFRTKIKEMLAAQSATERREERKQAAGDKVTPENKSTRLLDPANSAESNIKKLIEMGVINVGM